MKNLIGFSLALSLLAVPFTSFADSIVSASAGAGATISPSGSVVVTTGVTQVFSIGASAGYALSNVSVDGISQGAIGSYSLLGDLVDHSISAFAVSQGSLMPFCSGPMAPGWQMGVVGGGCGGRQVWVAAGTSDCPFWFVGGCVKEQ